MIESKVARALYSATSSGDVEAARALLRDHPEALHEPTPLGTWLHIAARNGQIGIVQLLLGAGLDVNVRGGRSLETALNAAAGRGHDGVVRFLLEAGAFMDVSEPDRNPLFSAIHGGHSIVANTLIKAGIDFGVSYSGERMKNMDALAFAREWGRTDIAELLLARGA